MYDLLHINLYSQPLIYSGYKLRHTNLLLGESIVRFHAGIFIACNVNKVSMCVASNSEPCLVKYALGTV